MHLNFSEFYTTQPVLPQVLSLYSHNCVNFLTANREFEKGNLHNALQLLKDEGSLDENLLKALIYLKANSVNKALNAVKKAIFIVNKYHSHFHFLGFDLNMAAFKRTGEEVYFKKAEFLYKPGLVSGEEVNFVPLQEERNLCIFKNIEASTIESVEAEHYNFHVSAAAAHFLHGLCYKFLTKPEIARVEFEKALKMEPKNPFNSVILKYLKNT